MEEVRNETREGVNLIKSKTRNEDLKMLAINTGGMDPLDKHIIEEAKKEIRVKDYLQKIKTSLVYVYFFHYYSIIFYFMYFFIYFILLV